MESLNRSQEIEKDELGGVMAAEKQARGYGGTYIGALQSWKGLRG